MNLGWSLMLSAFVATGIWLALIPALIRIQHLIATGIAQ